MPQDATADNVNVGKIIYQWSVQEYTPYERGRRWYVVMGGLGLLLVIYAVYSANYLFALIIILFGLILSLSSMRPPLEVRFAVTNTGIIVGGRYYRYSELTNFWVIYDPPTVKNLYFSFNNFFKHRLSVPLLDYDPRPIREYLAQYLEEDLEKEEEPFSDRLARLFRLH